jgi:integrase
LVLVAGAGTVPHADAQAPLPLVAILEPGPKATPSGGVQHFTEALADLGWVDGRTVRIETRYGEWEPERTTAMAQALLALRPDVLYTHSDRAARVAMRATTSVPIVVGAAADLVAVAGLKSLARPGGNVTGVTANQPELDRKRLEVLKGAVPAITKLPRIRFHDLRHTYASLLIAQGAHPKYIQAQLGHASIQTTLDRYGHLMPEMHDADARKLDRLVFGAETPAGGVSDDAPRSQG